MARVCYGVTISGSVNGAPRVTASGPTDDPYTGAAETSVDGSVTTVAANVATLVADAAAPTQAHVTTLNTNWGTLSTAWTALKAGPAFGDVVVSVNLANITTRTQLKAALDAIFAQAQGSSLLTA